VIVMAIYRIKELREKTDEELKKIEQELRTELSREKSAVKSGTKAENPGRIKEVKKTIARIKTIIKERGGKK